jgi:putative membrane protein
LGFIGFSLPYFHEFLISFVPFHLLLMGAILIANQKQFNKQFWMCLTLIILAGFIVDVIAVSTGSIFGQYNYSDHLGYKIADVPLIVGINWLILIFAVGSILKKRFKHQRNLKSIIGAIVIVLIDFLMEPVAQHFNFRTWENTMVPLQNYVAILIVSFVLFRIYHELEFRKSNPVALPLIVCEVLFLIGMNVTIA